MNELSPKTHHDVYQKIISVYDSLQEVVDAINTNNNSHAQDQLRVVGPFIQKVHHSMQLIVERYAQYVEQQDLNAQYTAKEIENSAREIFKGMRTLIREARMLAPAQQAGQNIEVGENYGGN